MKSWEIAGYLFALLAFLGCMWTLYAFGTGGWAGARLPLSLTISAGIIGFGIHTWGESRERGMASAIGTVITLIITQLIIFGIDWFTIGRE